MALVGFLEDRHVRQLPTEERLPLRRSGEAWRGVFASYLVEAGCPLLLDTAAYSHDRLLDYLRWLLNHAISLDYEEGCERINADAAAELAELETRSSAALSSGSKRQASPVILATPAADALIRQLAELLHVNIDGRDSLQALQAVHRSVRQRVVPALAAQEKAHASAAASSTASSDGAGASSSSSSSASGRPGPLPPASELLSLATFPLGFSTGNAVADRAAAILRMLYVTDLRELQDAVNDILVSVQEWTANPVVNASLGQVGR